MQRYDIINHFIKKHGFKKYLEIGVDNGTCIKKIKCDLKDGVDPADGAWRVPEINFQMTSDDFFKQNKTIYDIVFIDGLHHSEQVDLDIENSIKYTPNSGVILLHDCNPPTQGHAAVPRTQSAWNGDVYKSVLKFQKENKDHTFFTVDTDWGVGVILKNVKSNSDVTDEEYDHGISDWHYFDANRKRLLNLISVTDFEKYASLLEIQTKPIESYVKYTHIHNTALLGPNVKIEEDVYIGPYCVIGYSPEWRGRETSDCGVLIKKGTRITGHVTIDSGADRTTTIGENCYIMKHCHIGHDVVLGNNITMSPGSKIGGHCNIDDGVNFGMNSAVHQKLNIPGNCMIGANAFIGKTSKLRAGYKYAGVPVREIGENIIKSRVNDKPKISVAIQYSTSDFRFLECNLRQASKFSDDVIVTMCDRFFNGEPENSDLFQKSVKIMESFENVRLQIIPWTGMQNAAAYYHNVSRYTGYSMAKHDWILFLDADEIVTDEFGAWFERHYHTDATYIFSCNWYFRSPHNRAIQQEGAGCLMRKSHCENWDLNNRLELKQFYDKLDQEGKLVSHNETRVYSLTGKVMMHHFSWVRNKQEMLKKVSNWGHWQDKNWTQLVESEFTHPFNGRDFVHGYNYEYADNIFNIPTNDLD